LVARGLDAMRSSCVASPHRRSSRLTISCAQPPARRRSPA
jgi:hypothetical protein